MMSKHISNYLEISLFNMQLSNGIPCSFNFNERLSSISYKGIKVTVYSPLEFLALWLESSLFHVLVLKIYFMKGLGWKLAYLLWRQDTLSFIINCVIDLCFSEIFRSKFLLPEIWLVYQRQESYLWSSMVSGELEYSGLEKYYSLLVLG